MEILSSTSLNLVLQARSLAETYLSFLKPFLTELKTPDGIDFAVIRNLPVDPDLPPPPTNGMRPMQKKTWVSELVLLAIALAVGLEPFSYRQEQGDTLIHEIALTEADRWKLTPRQADVWEQRRQGKKHKEIARALYVSPETVKKHLARIASQIEHWFFMPDEDERPTKGFVPIGPPCAFAQPFFLGDVSM